MRTRDFRYVEWRKLESLEEIVWSELYDHRTDPDESVSVVGKPEYAGVLKKHAKLVRENSPSLQ